MRDCLRKGDILIIAVVLISALLFYPLTASAGREEERVIAEIIAEGRVVETIELSKVKTTLEEKINGTTILIEPGSISFVESDCRDRICIKAGKLSKAGQSAACVPNKVAVTLKSESENSGGIDAVTY